MPIRKKGNVEIQTSANGTKTKSTGFTFYSYDKKSAALYFQFKEEDGEPTDLSEATVHLVFILNDEKFIPNKEDIEIWTAIPGTARYIIPESMLGYEGKVTSYVYLDFSDGSHTDEGHFTFEIKRSLITDVIPEAGDKYVQDFEDVKAEVQEAADGATKDIEKARNGAESQIGDYVGEVESAKDSAVEDIDKALLVDEAKNYTDDKVEEFNETITTQLEENSQLIDQKASKSEARLKVEKLKLEDMNAETLAAIEGGSGTSFNLLSIPQKYSVTKEKLGNDLYINPNTLYAQLEKETLKGSSVSINYEKNLGGIFLDGIYGKTQTTYYDSTKEVSIDKPQTFKSVGEDLAIGISVSDGTNIISNTPIQLPHSLMGIGNFSDTITVRDGKWGVLKRIGSHTFSDVGYTSKPSSYQIDGYSTFSVMFNEGQHYAGQYDLRTGLFEDFQQLQFVYLNNPLETGEGFAFNGDSFRIRVADSYEFTIDTIKTYLSGKTFYFVLDTPIFEPFSDDLQVAIKNTTFSNGNTVSIEDAVAAELSLDVFLDGVKVDEIGINQFDDTLFLDIPQKYEMGQYHGSFGYKVESTTRIRTAERFYANTLTRIKLDDGVRGYLCFYDEYGFTESTGWFTGTYVFPKNIFANLTLSYETVDNFDDLESLASKCKIEMLGASLFEDKAIPRNPYNLNSETITSLNNKIETIISNENKLGFDNFSFVFVTDIHRSNSINLELFAKFSRYMKDNLVKFDSIVNGGDTVWDNYITEQFTDFQKKLKMYELNDITMNTVGNHDVQNISTKGKAEIFHYLAKGFNQKIILDDGYENDFYYYHDDHFNKVRYISLNTHLSPGGSSADYPGFSDREVKWFLEKAIDIPNNWGLVVFSHEPPQGVIDAVPSPQYTNNSLPVMDALDIINSKSSGVISVGTEQYNLDFTVKNNYVVGYFFGHVHADNIASYKSIKAISSDRLTTYDTTNEYTRIHFDYVSVDKTSRTVTLYKIGGEGTNRTYTY